jgi:hypothetical protein
VTPQLETWIPKPGPATLRYLRRIPTLSEDSQEKVLSESLRILGRCTDPTEPLGSRSVLVVGEVQSGKTLSFTTVMSLARENGFPLVVVLAGTKKNLHKQTTSRLEGDFASDGGAPQWLVLPSPRNTDLPQVLHALTGWNDPAIPAQYRCTVALVALKTPAGISRVTAMLQKLEESLGRSIPTLVVDDEADQASINVAQTPGSQSSTYAAISQLRSSLVNHSLLMYTATPQAPLLLDLVDHLSPDSVVVLRSGDTYVGGDRLFMERNSRFYREIPDSEIAGATTPGPGEQPPRSLLQSLAYFLVALSVAQVRENPRPLSMLIHPDTTKSVHATYQTWVNSILSHWKQALDDPEGRAELIQAYLASAISEIETTVDLARIGLGATEPLENEIAKLVRYWIPLVRVALVNSESASQEIQPHHWKEHPGWILIGGAKLDRGFTIENLAVTYMPRGIGIGNIDTIQQRGRFFGHKARYRDLLRGWLNSDTRTAFVQIVETDKEMRDDLARYDESGAPLSEWRRSLILGPGLRATRSAAISMAHAGMQLNGGFRFQQRNLFHPALAMDQSDAYDMIDPFFHTALPSMMDTRVDQSEPHLRADIDLMQLSKLLFDWPMAGHDRASLDLLLIAIRYYADLQPNTGAHLYFMNSLGIRKRKRDVKSPDVVEQMREWKIQNLLQGRSGPYAGDQFVRTIDAISVQIHNVAPTFGGQTFPDVLALAVAWPEGFERTILLQRS